MEQFVFIINIAAIVLYGIFFAYVLEKKTSSNSKGGEEYFNWNEGFRKDPGTDPVAVKMNIARLGVMSAPID